MDNAELVARLEDVRHEDNYFRRNDKLNALLRELLATPYVAEVGARVECAPDVPEDVPPAEPWCIPGEAVHRRRPGTNKCYCGLLWDGPPYTTAPAPAPDVLRDVIEMVRDLAILVNLIANDTLTASHKEEVEGSFDVVKRADAMLRARKEGL